MRLHSLSSAEYNGRRPHHLSQPCNVDRESISVRWSPQLLNEFMQRSQWLQHWCLAYVFNRMPAWCSQQYKSYKQELQQSALDRMPKPFSWTANSILGPALQAHGRLCMMLQTVIFMSAHLPHPLTYHAALGQASRLSSLSMLLPTALVYAVWTQ